MRHILILAILGASLCAVAQESAPLQRLVNDVAAKLLSGPADRGLDPYAMPVFHVVVTDQVGLNAQADAKDHIIFIGPKLVQILQNDIGELAFVIAHEVGHLQDAGCRERLAATKRMRDPALQRACEANADAIGVQYLLAAGFGPFDAAGAMGRLMLLDENQSSVTGIIVSRFTSDHPVDIDRIKHMADYARAACQQRPEVCKP